MKTLTKQIFFKNHFCISKYQEVSFHQLQNITCLTFQVKLSPPFLLSPPHFPSICQSPRFLFPFLLESYSNN